MFRMLYEMFSGHAQEVKDKTIGTAAYFGLVLLVSFIYFLIPAVPLTLWALTQKRGNSFEGYICFGVFALGLGASTVDFFVTRIQQQVRNDTLRGKPLDDTIEGE